MNKLLRFNHQFLAQSFKIVAPSSSLLNCQSRSIYLSEKRLDIFKIQDENDFKEKVLENSQKKLIILDFFATWCGPCKQLTPRLETIIGGQSTKVDLAKVDVDELEQLAAEYQVQTIPAIFAIKNGKIIDQFVGRRDDDELKSFIDGALAK
uniref:Thioredoxin, mitochondrial-like n=1 Tax=Dermatophagoides pteronyssinus TaxID=6956 RepID=A0A6P6Y7V4_DERPT|nr:thioredoxin, mitochondrial-like [Dermatophagoides pteronyssinus]